MMKPLARPKPAPLPTVRPDGKRRSQKMIIKPPNNDFDDENRAPVLAQVYLPSKENAHIATLAISSDMFLVGASLSDCTVSFDLPGLLPQQVTFALTTFGWVLQVHRNGKETVAKPAARIQVNGTEIDTLMTLVPSNVLVSIEDVDFEFEPVKPVSELPQFLKDCVEWNSVQVFGEEKLLAGMPASEAKEPLAHVQVTCNTTTTTPSSKIPVMSPRVSIGPIGSSCLLQLRDEKVQEEHVVFELRESKWYLSSAYPETMTIGGFCFPTLQNVQLTGTEMAKFSLLGVELTFDPSYQAAAEYIDLSIEELPPPVASATKTPTKSKNKKSAKKSSANNKRSRPTSKAVAAQVVGVEEAGESEVDPHQNSEENPDSAAQQHDGETANLSQVKDDSQVVDEAEPSLLPSKPRAPVKIPLPAKRPAREQAHRKIPTTLSIVAQEKNMLHSARLQERQFRPEARSDPEIFREIRRLTQAENAARSPVRPVKRLKSGGEEVTPLSDTPAIEQFDAQTTALEAVATTPAIVEEHEVVEEQITEERNVEEQIVEEQIVEEQIVEEQIVEEQIVEKTIVEEPIVEKRITEEQEQIVGEQIVADKIVASGAEQTHAELVAPVLEETAAKAPAQNNEPQAVEPEVQRPVVAATPESFKALIDAAALSCQAPETRVHVQAPAAIRQPVVAHAVADDDEDDEFIDITSDYPKEVSKADFAAPVFDDHHAAPVPELLTPTLDAENLSSDNTQNNDVSLLPDLPDISHLFGLPGFGQICI